MVATIIYVTQYANVTRIDTKPIHPEGLYKESPYYVDMGTGRRISVLWYRHSGKRYNHDAIRNNLINFVLLMGFRAIDVKYKIPDKKKD